VPVVIKSLIFPGSATGAGDTAQRDSTVTRLHAAAASGSTPTLE